MNYCIEDRMTPILSEFVRKIKEAADVCVELGKNDAYQEGFSHALGLNIHALAVVACAERLVDGRATFDDLRRTVETFRNDSGEKTTIHETLTFDNAHAVSK